MTESGSFMYTITCIELYHMPYGSNYKIMGQTTRSWVHYKFIIPYLEFDSPLA